MKQYNLQGKQRQMSFGEITVIALGERGRGRYEALVPFQGDIKETDLVMPAPTKSGKTKIIKGGTRNGWIARISCEGCYTRGTTGEAWVHKKDAEKVIVIASGNGAEGDAGRIGWWADYLLHIQDDTLIRVKRHGGYKTPAYYLFFGYEKVFHISSEELPIWLDGHDHDYGYNKEKASDFFTIIDTQHEHN